MVPNTMYSRHCFLFSFLRNFMLLICASRLLSAATPSKLLPIEEDCAVNKMFTDLQCNEGHEFYRYTQLSHDFNSASSCATCDCEGYTGTEPRESPEEEFYNLGPKCCQGWQGSQCDLCQTVDVCPSKDINGSSPMAATSCTARSMAPLTVEEAMAGKKFSCSCGGGGDFESKFACPQQGTYKKLPSGADGAPVTRFDWTYFSSGAIELAMNVGIHSRSWEDYPGEFDYLYPIVWTADLTGCTITEGECMALGGSNDDFAEQVCINYKCVDTEVSCPPKDKPECPGGVNSCDVPEGQKKPYQMHRCSVLPDSGVAFETSCLKEPNEDGSFLCFFKQPTLTAPMSMTCYTGTCLYNATNGTDTVDYDETSRFIPRGLLWQQLMLGGFVVSIIIFAVAIRLIGNRMEDRREAEYLKGVDVNIATCSFEALPCERLTLSWNNISLWVQDDHNNEKPILHDVKGAAFGLTALLGPSGSGKTSLLDCLASRKAMHRIDGTIRINGNPSNSEIIRRVSGFVPQEDIFPGYLTVYEHLLFHAALRCPASLGDSDVRRRVHKVLTVLDLNKCAQSRIGDEFNRGLSGGEKRRLSLAEELLIQPAVLFLDEPTTGLDSSSAKLILLALNEYSRRGTTVLMSLHQPSVSLFRILDNVIVLSKGKVIFDGPPSAVPLHIDRVNDMFASFEERSTLFATHPKSDNPADLLLDVASCMVRSKLAHAIAEDRLSTADTNPPKIGFEVVYTHGIFPEHHEATIWKQIKVLFTRICTAALRRPALLLLQYAGCTFLALTTGSIFFDLKEDLYGVQDRFGVLFFIPFCLVLLGLSSLHCWRDERVLLMHEKSYKQIYGFPAYFISVILFDVVFVRILPPTAFALISYHMIGLNQGCNYCLLTFALILVLTNVISSLMAMVVGAFHFSLLSAQLIGVVIALYSALFSGYLVNEKSIGQSGFLYAISTDPMSYTFEALLINQFGSQTDVDGNEVYYFINGSMCAPSLPTTLSSGDMILGTFGFEENEHALKSDILALALGLMVYLVLTFGVSISSLSCILMRCTRFCATREHISTGMDTSIDSGVDQIRSNLLSDIDDWYEEEDEVATNCSLEELLEDQLGRNSMAPLVLSFHDISLCIPSIGELRTTRTQVGQSSEQQITFICESTATNLGMSFEKDPELGLEKIVQIFPGSWAQRQGLLLGDVVTAVGGIALSSSDDLFALLERSSPPLHIKVLRSSKRKLDPPPSPPLHEVPMESDYTNSYSYTQFYGTEATEVSTTSFSETCRSQAWILKGVSGTTLSSEAYRKMSQVPRSQQMPHMVTALLGPSGSGKTSLLDVLSGRKTVGTFTGSVRINGKVMTWSDMRSLSGYVTQEDILPGLLSVRECLQFQAQLRVLGSPSSIAQRVSNVLQHMELTSCEEQIIGTSLYRGLSGGEKRRLSVAIELLSKPAILFCDEPTTGLDSHSALLLCQTLEEVARSGTTVMMSIHQPGPEIFKLITQAIFLTRDGQVCFCGPRKDLENYLAEDSSCTRVDEGNLADAMLHEISSCDKDALVKAFKVSQTGRAEREVLEFLSNLQQRIVFPKSNEVIIQSRGKYKASWTTQFRHLSFRTMRYGMRNPFPFLLHGITAVAAALILGFAFYNVPKLNDETAGVQNRFGMMFFLVLYLSLLALTSLSIWREEQRLFVVERGSGIYCTSSYLLASFLFDVLPYRMLPPLAFSLITYPMVGLNDVSSAHRWIFFAVLFASNLTFSSVCMLIGILARSNASANAAGSLAMLTSILFCGFLFSKRDDMSWLLTCILRWSPGSYAFEALVVNEMLGLENLYVTTTISHSEARAGPFSGTELANCFGFTGGVRFDLVTLLIMAGVYFSAVFFAMKYCTKEVR